VSDARPSRFRCLNCGHWCNWADGYGWICDRRGGCGYEWEEPERVWEPVYRHIDKPRSGVVYWRLIDVDDDGRSLGAVAKNDDGTWRALIYGPDRNRPHVDRRPLGGEFQSWQAARRAVQREVMRS